MWLGGGRSETTRAAGQTPNAPEGWPPSSLHSDFCSPLASSGPCSLTSPGTSTPFPDAAAKTSELVWKSEKWSKLNMKRRCVHISWNFSAEHWRGKRQAKCRMQTALVEAKDCVLITNQSVSLHCFQSTFLTRTQGGQASLKSASQNQISLQQTTCGGSLANALS